MMLFNVYFVGGRYVVMAILFIFSCLQGHATTLTTTPTRIQLLQTQTLLSYESQIRLSHVLTEAFTHIGYDVYPLGMSLVNVNKQHLVDEKRQHLIERLNQIDTDESRQIMQQLMRLPFAYREKIHTRFDEIRANAKFDPMLAGEYQLSLPKRPNTVTLISASKSTMIVAPFKNNRDLTFYLDTLTDTDRYRPVWVIQADQTVYQVTDHDWKKTRFFLAPGAIVFVELENLPVAYESLNGDIAHFLAYRLEL